MAALWYSPRQILEGPNAGRWIYTGRTLSGAGSSPKPVGACANDCPGHATPDEASHHYAEGICAGEILEREDELVVQACAVCRAWTNHRAMLCDDVHEDEHPICASGHDIRAALRLKYFKRRGLKT